ncbi:MAG: hypothetical protein ACM31C_02315 [Acidobacteriota bacterium]
MTTRVEADVEVQRFGFATDEGGKRLVFPHAHTKEVGGKSGGTGYGAADCTFEGLEGRLDTLRWEAQSASLGGAWLRDDAGRFDIVADRVELPHGIRLVRAERGIELLSPHVSFSEARLTIKGPFSRRPAAPSEAPAGLRQERLRFLDSLSGRIYFTVKVQLDLPVLGVRTLDQQLRVPVQEGSLDYRALDDSLDWLEGQFLDIKHDDHRLRVQWKVPIFGSSHDLISWGLDTDASTLAAFGRVPVRSLADFRIGAGTAAKAEDKKRKVLQAFTLDAIDIALSLLAPRNLEVGGGMILFGGEDQPGLVDLKVTGALRDKGAGALRGAIGSIDLTVSDLRFGPLLLSADRLHFDGLDQLEVTFDGFKPTAVTMVVHRVTATNLDLKIGR